MHIKIYSDYQQRTCKHGAKFGYYFHSFILPFIHLPHHLKRHDAVVISILPYMHTYIQVCVGRIHSCHGHLYNRMFVQMALDWIINSVVI